MKTRDKNMDPMFLVDVDANEKRKISVQKALPIEYGMQAPVAGTGGNESCFYNY